MLGFIVMGILAAVEAASKGSTSTQSATDFQKKQNPIDMNGLVTGGLAQGLLTTAPPGSTSAAIVQGSTYYAQNLIAQGAKAQPSPYAPAVQQSGPLKGYVTGPVTQPIAAKVGGQTVITNVPTGVLNLLKSGRI